ncbi:hypothetical protein [Nocardioides flavescens]|uniref:Uncharacterized protein n=1 Tax=Nocardioides flavescens TaxID=2691959 RepID=A0A6L7EZA8_9ACTN|nr:hypothetical protein [Nocardioides flavescens]MXG91068.1 hypothetical protein [Nocardioides flavescens]
MSENAAESPADHADEPTPGEVDDSVLPEDVRPGEDNPLAEGLDDAETAGDLAPGELLEEGKTPDQWDGDEAPSDDTSDDTGGQEQSGTE